MFRKFKEWKDRRARRSSFLYLIAALEKEISSLISRTAEAESIINQLRAQYDAVISENTRYQRDNEALRSERDLIKNIILPEWHLAHEHNEARWKAAIAENIAKERRAI